MIRVRPKHIFLVEDNELYSLMVDYILSNESIFRFISFKSGEECLDNLYLNPDIIILDYGLPGMDGYETLLQIKARHPHIHVIILTSHSDEELRKELIQAGADGYILKQGHGELQIISQVESILNNEGVKPKSKAGSFFKTLVSRLFFLS